MRQPGFRPPGLIALQAVALFLIGLTTFNTHWIGMHLGDLSYYDTAARHIIRGQTPYRDFALAYPPLSLWSFCLPYLFSLGRPLEFWTYAAAFLAESVLWSTLIALALARLSRQFRFAWDDRRILLLYLLLVTVSSVLLPWRFDLFPIFLTLVSLWCILARRPGAAGIWLGLGVAAKLYPIVLLPVFTLLCLARKSPREAIRLQGGFWAALLLCLVPLAHVPLPAFLSFLRFHEMRGLEVESLPAGMILLAHHLGWVDARIVNNYGACHLATPIAHPIIASLPLFFGFTNIVVLQRCRQAFQREHGTEGVVTAQTVAHYSVAALTAFILCNKVFSTQYIFWIMPFIPLLRPRLAAAMGIVFALTCAIFPFAWRGLVDMEIGPLLLLNARNVLLVGLFVQLLRKDGGEVDSSPRLSAFIPDSLPSEPSSWLAPI